MSKLDNYKNMKDSFETGYENISDKELVHLHKTTDSMTKRQDISLEMTRRLKQSIEEFNTDSSKQSKVIIKLTKWIIILTIAMLLMVGVQILLIF